MGHATGDAKDFCIVKIRRDSNGVSARGFFMYYLVLISGNTIK